MTTQYSTSLRLALIGDGDQAGTWGDTTNYNFGTLVEEALTGVVAISLTGLTTYTLKSYNGTYDDARSMVLIFAGSPTATVTITAPLVNKFYVVVNNTSQTITMSASGGSQSLNIPANVTAQCYCDASNVSGNGAGFYSAQTGSAGNFFVNGTLTASGVADVGNLSVGGTLGVTGASTFTGAAALNGAVSGTGIAAYMASPPAIGGTAAAAGTFTTLSANSVSASSAVSGASVSDTIGNVRNIPIEAKSTAYVLQASDNGQCISITTGGVTVPASVFAANNVVTIYNNSGSTQVITQGSGLTLQFAGQPTSTTGNRNLSLYGIATVLFLSPTSAVITGAGLY